MPTTSTITKRLRLEAGISQSRLAEQAKLDRATIAKAEKGHEVSELTLWKLSSALSKALGREIASNEIIDQGSEL